MACYAQLDCYYFGRKPPKHIIKTNLLSAAFRGINLQYERELKDRFTVNVGATYTPLRSVPFEDFVASYIENESDRALFRESRYAQFSLMPEARFYFGNRPSFTRFYTSAYLRYARYQPRYDMRYSMIVIDEDNTVMVMPYEIRMRGQVNMLSVGYGVGVQFNVWDDLFLDWKIVGTHVGFGFGRAKGIPSQGPIPESVQRQIEDQFASVDVPVFSISGTANDNEANIRARGPIVGVTMGLSIGYRLP